MMGKKIIPFLITLLLMGIARPALAQVEHREPAPVLLGETLRLELTRFRSRQPVYDLMVYYRMQGDYKFKARRMRQEGLVYYSEIPTARLQPGNLEYYFAFQTVGGRALFLPSSDPENNPYRVKILPAKTGSGTALDQMDILLLSPEPGELISPEEFIISLSVPLEVSHPEDLSYKLLIGGVNVSKLLKREDHLLYFAPKTIRSGLHNAEFQVFDKNGNMLGEKQFSFRISSQPSRRKGFDSRTTLFFDNRYQQISDNADNYYRGGLYFIGEYKKFSFQSRLLFSSEESANRQPVNQYSAMLRYNFSNRHYLYLKGGDITTNYHPLAFWEKRIRGFGAGFYSRWFDFDYTFGSSARGIEGLAVEDSLHPGQYTVQRFGTYKQRFMAIRPAFHFGSHLSWSLNVVNGKDDPESISYGSNPKESLVMGTGVALNFDRHRFVLEGSFQANIRNEDAVGEVDFDTLAEKYNLSEADKDLAGRFIDIMESTGFLSLTQGLSPIPNLAMQFETRLNYFNHQLRATYKKIESDYKSPGNPYLLRDIQGFFINDNIRMLNNQVFMNLYFKLYDNNLSNKDTKTRNTDLGGSISYFPFSNLPSITLSYGNQSRQNELAKQNIDPDSTYLLLEDNTTQRIGLSSSLNVTTGAILNTISFSASSYKRNDVYDFSQSDFTLLSAGLRNRFSFPLTTHFTYSKTASGIGKGDSERTTDIRKIFFSLDYDIRNIMREGSLKPFVNISVQQIKDNNPLFGNYDRKNYTAGFYFRHPGIGNLSLRYDFIDYGNSAAYKTRDSILSTRYEIDF